MQITIVGYFRMIMAQIRYTHDQREFILINWAELKRLPLMYEEKVAKFRTEFAGKYPGVQIPCMATVFRIARKFKQTGTVINRKSSREKTAICRENQAVIEYVIG